MKLSAELHKLLFVKLIKDVDLHEVVFHEADFHKAEMSFMKLCNL